MQPPLQELIRFLADTQAADQILEGKFQPPEGTDIYTQKMLKELKMPDSIRNQPTTSHTIPTQEHIDSWNKQKESTASDTIAGISFSHYIAGAQDPTIAEFDH